jgi:hypothetical protein
MAHRLRKRLCEPVPWIQTKLRFPPFGLILVFRGSLELVFGGVHCRLPCLFILARQHDSLRVYGNIFSPHPKKSADADDICFDGSRIGENDVIDITDRFMPLF